MGVTGGPRLAEKVVPSAAVTDMPPLTHSSGATENPSIPPVQPPSPAPVASPFTRLPEGTHRTDTFFELSRVPTWLKAHGDSHVRQPYYGVQPSSPQERAVALRSKATRFPHSP